MSILIFIETQHQEIHPHALQALQCGLYLGKTSQQSVSALVLSNNNKLIEQLNHLGIQTLYTSPPVDGSDSLRLHTIFQQCLQESKAKTILLMHSDISKVIAPQLAIMNDAAFAPACMQMPVVTSEGIEIKRTIFSGKATQTLLLNTAIKVITILPNSITFPSPLERIEAPTLNIPLSMNEQQENHIQIISTQKINTGEISLADAEIVVSGGMGMGAANHWHLLEKLAEKLHAAKACTRLVADAGWRPHHEHVGQTGTTIAPHVYIAVGISGAIQHLAGVNQSKLIVAINKNKDAPIFQYADYGIVGDALEIIPKLLA